MRDAFGQFCMLSCDCVIVLGVGVMLLQSAIWKTLRDLVLATRYLLEAKTTYTPWWSLFLGVFYYWCSGEHKEVMC